MRVLGIDIGGSGIKGAVVNTRDGSFEQPRLRIKTPKKMNPELLSALIDEMLGHFNWDGPVGCGFPGVIRNGTIYTAVNLDPSLVGLNLAQSIVDLGADSCEVLNDADAAGLCECALGAGRDLPGVVLVLTIGTGIGSALFIDGKLVPNTELGHIEFCGRDAEKLISEQARKSRDLSWPEWTSLFESYLSHLRFILQPDRIILGGGGVKKPEKFMPLLKKTDDLALAAFGNRAGIIGAALRGLQAIKKPVKDRLVLPSSS